MADREIDLGSLYFIGGGAIVQLAGSEECTLLIGFIVPEEYHGICGGNTIFMEPEDVQAFIEARRETLEARGDKAIGDFSIGLAVRALHNYDQEQATPRTPIDGVNEVMDDFEGLEPG